MPDKGTTQDHIADLMAEVYRLTGEVQDYRAANEELRLKLAIAQAEVDGYVKRHDRDRRHIVELGERFAAMCAMQGDLMRQLEEARGE